MTRVAPEAARAVIVARQGFAARRRTATAGEVEATIGRLGCVQLDSVMTVDRAHRLTLAARVGRVPADTLNTLRRSGRVFEYWAHEACLLPIDDYPYFDATRRRREHPWWRNVLADHADLARRILDDTATDGPRSPRDYGGGGGGWWEWTPVKKVFEALWTAGELAVRERRGFERIYDLTENLIPSEIRSQKPEADEVLRHFVRRTVAARGLVTIAGLADYYRLPGGRKAVAPAVAELVDVGELEPVEVAGHAAVVDRAAATALAQPTVRPATSVLLCPFDNLIWDRAETERLFGFRHALEIYKPAPKRVHGYYVLPLLAGDRLIGRVDLKSDRRAGVLRVLRTHWESRPARGHLDAALRRLAHTLALTIE